MENLPPTELYHYTMRDKLSLIIESGVIRLADLGLTGKELAVVWLSASTSWEETCNRAMLCDATDGTVVNIPLNRDMTHRMNGGLVRLVFKPSAATHDWKAFKRDSGITSKTAKCLYTEAISVGSKPSLWRVSFNPIPLSDAIRLDFWGGEAWVDDPVEVDTPTDVEVQEFAVRQTLSGKVRPAPGYQLSDN